MTRDDVSELSMVSFMFSFPQRASSPVIILDIRNLTLFIAATFITLWTLHKMFGLLGFTPDDAQAQFGFLMNAFEYGAPPHGGIAFGFDRLCSLFGGADSIRDFIAFPKNNAGRDVMIDSPSPIHLEQLTELGIAVKP